MSTLPAGGCLMGIAIAAMHYAGMAATRMLHLGHNAWGLRRGTRMAGVGLPL
jgi:NO-binding membrane sensor protein with MHYT domain